MVCCGAGHASLSPLAPFSVLPNITPAQCAVVMTIVLLCSSWYLLRPQAGTLSTEGKLLAVCNAYFVGFLFGWHVHEKAIIVPLLILG